ncbi:hypothetical protein [Tautonia plasticadhaerens]|uniref:Uncharacterized protein n=1 Tax=Tautonia plasticadhaerens TaxID=2527974 RepID=A0A518H2N6_9BACT|nr:hypothetical protein [Tautonia plasticadhaerens]QDV35112.1 hypothetical protein ElP_30140 [Tautonia plasticadhaerens]
MNRIALSIALAVGLAVGVPPASAEGPPASGTVPAAPPWFDDAPEGGITPIGDGGGGPVVARGRRSLTEERALADARLQLDRAVSGWLDPDVPEGWEPPADLVDALVLGRHVEPILVDRTALGLSADPDLPFPDLFYVAALRADLSPQRREGFLDVHRREVGARRSAMLGGAGGFVLACLAILALYIRADEATKGYYTNRLRLAAVASAGAAGAAISQFLA